ncbi:MAG: hypothetical protein ACO1RT_16215 [Planctomycetaceae bacterium]
MSAIPEPTERNRAVWNAWDSTRGNSEQQRAQARFSADQYQRFPDVCYFSEHEANSVGPDGQPMVRKYDAAKLREIIEENNLRIADVDAYPTIIDRHTAPAGTRDPAAPETLGVAGPFRLGMIGRISPRFAIFTDEYVRKDKLPQMASKGGRSVEVLTMKTTGRSYINPIAAISEAPRLPLPVQFSFGAADDEYIERYSVVAQYSAGVPAFAGGGNTFVQKFDTQSPDGDSQASSTNPGDGQMNEQLIRQIIDALMATEQMQWVTQQMGSGGTPAGGAAPQPAAPATPPQQPQQFGGGMGMGGGMGASAMRYQTAESYYTPTEDEADLAERYQALASGQAQLINELAETRSQLATLAVAKADADRSARLRELASRVPIDLDRELQTCLYSAGSDYDDARFEAHIDTVERYAAKSIEQMPMVPTGVTGGGNATQLDTAQYQAQESAMIKTLINEYANKGVSKPYPELKTEARQRLGQQAAT